MPQQVWGYSEETSDFQDHLCLFFNRNRIGHPIYGYLRGNASVSSAKKKQWRKEKVKTNRERKRWSGRGDLNPRQLAWEARTLPLSYARSFGQDSHSR